MHRVARLGSILLAVVLFGWAGSVPALTICIGPCESGVEPLPPVTIVDPLDLADFPTTDVAGLIIAGGDALGPYNVDGDLVLHVPSGSLVADVIDLRSGGGVLDVQISLLQADALLFCTIGCEPFESEVPGFVGDPFHITVLAPLTGALGIFASGSVLVTSEPIPQPSTAHLLAIGCAALASGKPRLFARTKTDRLGVVGNGSNRSSSGA